MNGGSVSTRIKEELRITVALIAKAAEALETTVDRTKLSKTDVVNRAIQLYEFVDSELSNDAELMIRRPDGSTHMIKLL
jgi:hypothetical protein